MNNEPVELIELTGQDFLELLERESLDRIIYLFGEDEVKAIIDEIVHQNKNLERRKNELLNQILIRNQYVKVTKALNRLKEKVENITDCNLSTDAEKRFYKKIIKEYYTDLRREGLIYEQPIKKHDYSNGNISKNG